MRRLSLVVLTIFGVLAAPASADITVTPASGTEGGVITFEVTRDNALEQAEAETVDGTAGEGDFVAFGGEEVFTGLGNTAEVEVQTIADDVPEIDETFTLRLTNPVGGAELAKTSGTIRDDDPPGVAILDGGAVESDGGLSFGVARSAVSGTTTLSWAVTAGTATAADLGATSGTLNIPPGATFGVITIPVVNDADDEEAETVGVTISGAGANITRNAATGTITNDDVRALSVGDARVTEGDGDERSTARVLVSLDAPTFRTVTAQFATVNLTARAPVDFLQRAGAVTIRPGQTQAFLDVPVTSDDDIEKLEQFAVLVGRQSGASLADGAAVVTVTDDDAIQGDQVPPDVRVTRVRRSGRSISLRVSCPRSEQRCAGRVTLFTRADRRSRVRSLRRERRIARRSFRIDGGRARTLRLTVPRRIRSAARRAGRLRVRAFVVTEDASENTDTTTKNATLRFRR